MFSGEHVAIGITALAIIAGLAIALVSRRDKGGEVEYVLKSGLLVDAEIIGYENNDFLWVTYRFLPIGSRESVTCKKALRFGAERLPVGSVVPVRYLAKFPSISLIVPYATHQFPSS
jgi:hypothetical protein